MLTIVVAINTIAVRNRQIGSEIGASSEPEDPENANDNEFNGNQRQLVDEIDDDPKRKQHVSNLIFLDGAVLASSFKVTHNGTTETRVRAPTAIPK